MDSTTKNRQPVHVIRAMVARAYGAAQVPVDDDAITELTYGFFNALYRVRLRDGQDVVLKIAPPADVPVLSHEHGMLRNEVAAMDLVRRLTDVPVPRVDHVDLTRELCDADYFFMEHVDATCFGIAADAGELGADEVEAGFVDLGRLNAEICRVVGPHFGPLAGPGHATWREAFTAMVEAVLADGERVGIDLGWTADEVRGVLAEHADVLDDVTEPRLVELDLWAKNSMIRDGRIVAIIDHERAMYGDPLMEAGLTSLDLPAFPDPAPFARGFGLGTLTPSQVTRRQLSTLWLCLVMLVENPYRGQSREQLRWAREQLDTAMGLLGRTRA